MTRRSAFASLFAAVIAFVTGIGRRDTVMARERTLLQRWELLTHGERARLMFPKLSADIDAAGARRKWLHFKDDPAYSCWIVGPVAARMSTSEQIQATMRQQHEALCREDWDPTWGHPVVVRNRGDFERLRTLMDFVDKYGKPGDLLAG